MDKGSYILLTGPGSELLVGQDTDIVKCEHFVPVHCLDFCNARSSALSLIVERSALREMGANSLHLAVLKRN